jgi:hypothetical protein
MKSDSLDASKTISSPYRYSDPSFREFQSRFDALVQGGAGLEELEKFIRSVYTARNRAIRNQDFAALKPSSVAKDYLLPRRDLTFFILDNWLKSIFLPALREETVEGMLVFGVGRIFSSYNDSGIQRSTDVDINIVVRDDLHASRRAEILEALGFLKRKLFEYFKLNLEIDKDFTLLREKDVLKRMKSADAGTKLNSILFYKTNCRSIHIIKDEASIRSSIFAPARKMPDALIFENFLGLANPRVTFTKILSGRSALPILADESCERVEVSSVIGARAFMVNWQRFFPKALGISPPEWYFSMKYYVNRVFDYACAMQNLGYGLPDIGFSAISPELGMDPDYRFLRNAHAMMLYFQELEEMVMRSFNADCDYSYVSRARFTRLTEIDGDKFKRDFAEMALTSDILFLSEKTAFRALKRKIDTHAQDRYVTGKTAMLKLLPPGFRYETIFKDDIDFKIRIPYSWSDLGYLVFDAIAHRMARIVTEKLVPPLASLGMPPGEHTRYLSLAEELGLGEF